MDDKQTYPVLHSILEEHFQFDRIFILGQYGLDLHKLHKELESLCRDQYENNYRFIFLHFDTDYHITNDQPGLVLRNLQRILRDLDISNYFCMVVSQKDLQADLDLLQKQETTDDCSIYCLQYPIEDVYQYNDFKLDLNVAAVEHNFICLNRAKRKHRTILYALLKHKNLLNKGLVRYGSKS